MAEAKRVSFRLMNDKDDLVLMLKWLTDERVLEFYDGRDAKYTAETIREKYTEEEDDFYRMIIEYDSVPIGYAQMYRVQGELFEEYDYPEMTQLQQPETEKITVNEKIDNQIAQEKDQIAYYTSFSFKSFQT